jgi:hypothetical protein
VFVLLALVTRGAFAFVYLALAFVIPSAETSEERAAARGEPFNAQELIDRAKQHYAQFTGGREWRREWRRQHRAWRDQWRASRWHARADWGGGRWAAASAGPAPAGDYGTRMAAGALVPVLGLISVLVFWFWAWAIVSLIITGQVLGQTMPDELPLWMGIVILVVAYHAVAWPLHFARRRAAYSSRGGSVGMMAAWDGVLSLGVGLMIAWIAYHYIPQVREILRIIPDVWDSLEI